MTSHNEQDMDAKRLASITADAVSNVLFFHTKKITPPVDIRRAGLELAIDTVFHLRLRAADIAVAHLEIACDAALSYANDYNELHPDNTINPRWMYICVQALLSHQLIPAKLEGGKVQRLVDCVTHQQKDVKVEQKKRRSASDLSGLDDGPTLSSIEVPIPPSQRHKELDVAVDNDENEDDDEDENVSGQALRARSIIMPTPKMPWTDEDIRFLIELRAMGMTHMQTAEYLKRGQGAVENKYGRVVRETAWKPYVDKCAARYIKVRRGKRKLPSSEMLNEAEDEDEEDEEDEVVRRRRLTRKRRLTLAVAAAVAKTTAGED